MSTLTPLPPTEPGAEQPTGGSVPTGPPASPRQTAAWAPQVGGGRLLAYLLILFGVLFLIAQLVPLGGSVFLLGIGLAFVVARVATDRYGYAVPAGLLLGLGFYGALHDAGVVLTYEPGAILIFLGLGFLAIYPLGGSRRLYWPVIPGAILVLLGLVQVEPVLLAPLPVYSWAPYVWPVALILLGALVLAREVIAREARVAIGAVLVVVLFLSATLALGQPTTLTAPIGVGQPTVLTAPMTAGQTLRIANLTGGSVTVVPGAAGQVRATVTKPFGTGPLGPVYLGPSAGGVALEARSIGSWPNASPPVSLVVAAPRDAALVVEGSSGDVTIADRAASVQVQISSGNVMVSRVDGSADLTTSSGNIRATDVTGPFTARASSGNIDGSGLLHPISAETSSGNIHLSGAFSDNASVRATSGSVTLGLAPDSSTRISINNTSGAISTRGLTLSGVSQSPHQFNGTLGSGAGTLTIQSTSGDVLLESMR